MDIKLIRRLVRLMTGGKISELEIDDTQNGLRVRLKSNTAEGTSQGSPVVYHMQGHMPAAMPGGGGGMAPSHAAQGAGGMPEQGAAAAAAANLHPITSPLVGTFYRSSSPDSDPYVEPGTRVGPDTLVCIIEAMKVMNEIRAEVSGEIVQMLVENGEPVEYGQPLFMVKKG